MAYAPKHLPALQSGSCVFSDYGQEWIEGLLRDAAQQAGVRLPFLGEIARGVMLYLECECPLNTLPLSYLILRLRAALEEMGLPLIAQNLRCKTPPVQIDLPQLAGEESSLPLFFYAGLRQRLDGLQRLGLNDYRFTGRERCSLMLGARRRACPTQRRALAELDAFLNSRCAAR